MHKPFASLRAVVITPPIQDFYATPHRISSIGAKLVTSILENEQFETFFIEGTTSPSKPHILPLPKTLAHLAPHLILNETGKCSFFTSYRHFGASYGDLANKVQSYSPHLCCIACFAFCYAESAIELADAIKQMLPHTTILAGGAGVSVHPRWFLEHSSIDYTITGEAETALPAFLDFFKNGQLSAREVPSLGWRHDREIHLNQTAPATTSVMMRPAVVRSCTDKWRDLYAVSLSRGCGMSCSFCANRMVHGTVFRHTSLNQLSNELDKIHPEDCLPVHINFEDDNLLFDWPFFCEVISLCKQKFSALSFTAENGLDYRLLDKDKLIFLMDTGFSQFNFTIGSVNEGVLKSSNRTGWPAHFDELLLLANKRNIPVISYVICGLPGDTPDTIATSLSFLYRRDIVAGMSLFYPVPGLEGFTDLSRFDALTPRLACGSSAFPWNPDVSTTTLVTAFRIARFINFVKQPHHDEIEKELIAQTQKNGRLYTVIKDKKSRKIVAVPVQDEALATRVLLPAN